MPSTYSFLDVKAALVGPGAAFDIGSGSGASEEGITIAPTEEINNMAVGADGQVMHSLRADKSGKVTIRLLKTSPTNALLGAALQFQRTSGANHGQNTITLVNIATGDTISCQQVAFSRWPDLKYAKDGGVNEWMFDAGVIDQGLGNGG